MERFQFCELFYFDAKSNNTVDLQIKGHKWLIRKKIKASAVESNSNLIRDKGNPIHTILEFERPVSAESVNVHLKLFLSPGHYATSLKKFTKIFTIPKHQKKIEIFVSKNDIDFEIYDAYTPITFSDWLIGSVSVTSLDSLSFLSEDFANLLDSGASSDFVLRCDGQEFHVHKCILAARSSVLDAMFLFHNNNVNAQDPSIECGAVPNAEAMGRKRKKLEDSIQETSTSFNAEDIVDMKPDILKKMLKYIYSGRIDDLTSTDAMDLLYGADKYQLTLLKEICFKKLKSTLSPNNVLDILVIGDLHDQSLKAHAMEFIGNKYPFSEMKKTDKWKSLQTTHPTLAIEVLTFVVETKESLQNSNTSNSSSSSLSNKLKSDIFWGNVMQ